MSDDTPSDAPRRPRRPRVPADLLNSIEPAGTARESAVPTSVRSAPSDSAPVNPSHPPTHEAAPRGFAAVPENVLDRYYRIRNEFFLDNGELAFVNHGERLSTRSENVEIVRDLVRIAHHNGYSAITVTGTERFRREAWGEATRLGLVVHGYTPNDHDKKQWVRSLAREDARQGARAGIPESEPAPNATTTRAVESDHRPQDERSPQNESPLQGRRRQGPQDNRAYFGELLDHGADHYQHNPREELSYFVKLQTSTGVVELWGQDLKRALEQSKSNPRVGNAVGILQTGQKPVTVKSRLFDEAGQFLRAEDKAAHRNHWLIEKVSFFDERAQLAQVLRDPRISAQEGGERHPQLVGTYFVLKEGEEFAKQSYASPTDRESFVSLMRERLAQEIERGEALRTTHIRDRSPTPEKELHNPHDVRRPPDLQEPRRPQGRRDDPEHSR